MISLFQISKTMYSRGRCLVFLSKLDSCFSAAFIDESTTLEKFSVFYYSIYVRKCASCTLGRYFNQDGKLEGGGGQQSFFLKNSVGLFLLPQLIPCNQDRVGGAGVGVVKNSPFIFFFASLSKNTTCILFLFSLYLLCKSDCLGKHIGQEMYTFLPEYIHFILGKRNITQFRSCIARPLVDSAFSNTSLTNSQRQTSFSLDFFSMRTVVRMYVFSRCLMYL